MANLPIFQTNNKDFLLFQNSWKAAILPILNNNINQGILIENVELAIGSNAINHLLGRMQQGWMIADVNAGAVIYRSAAFNNKTLTLTSDTNCIVSLWMF